MLDQEYSQASSSAQFGKSTPHPAKASKTTDEPAVRHAFDDLTTITTAGHAKLTRAIQERYLRLYDWGAWAIGMPRLEEIQPSKAAIVIMNAGGGQHESD